MLPARYPPTWFGKLKARGIAADIAYCDYTETYISSSQLKVAVAMKPVEFCGNSRDKLRAFPVAAKRECGFQIGRLELGLEPADWKPFPSIGPGVSEIRITDAEGAFRILYVAKFTEAIYVLHCFQKKTQKTSAADIYLATRRYRALIKERRK